MRDNFANLPPWEPKEDEFQAYQKREVELADLHINVKKIPASDTLYSRFTLKKIQTRAKGLG